MSTSTKCRALGGPANCKDPDCPQRKAFEASFSPAVKKFRDQADANMKRWLRTSTAAKELIATLNDDEHVPVPDFIDRLGKQSGADPDKAQNVFRSLLGSHELHLDLTKGVRKTTESEREDIFAEEREDEHDYEQEIDHADDEWDEEDD